MQIKHTVNKVHQFLWYCTTIEFEMFLQDIKHFVHHFFIDSFILHVRIGWPYLPQNDQRYFCLIRCVCSRQNKHVNQPTEIILRTINKIALKYIFVYAHSHVKWQFTRNSIFTIIWLPDRLNRSTLNFFTLRFDYFIELL